jgi:hypothetical protein
MSRLRERPRLVAARVLGAALLLGVGVAIGVLANDSGGELSGHPQAQLKRAKLVNADRADRLGRTGAELQALRAKLEESVDHTSDLARANAGLRQQLRRATRALRRAQRARRGRPR